MKKSFIVLSIILIFSGFIKARTLEKILESKTIVVGTTDIDSEPSHYRDKKGGRTGIDIDIAEYIANELEVTIKYAFLYSPKDRIPALKEDSVDIVISNFSITGERKESILFSDPYVKTGVGVLLNKKYKNSIKNFEDLRKSNISISLNEGTIQHRILKKEFPNIQLLLRSSTAESQEAFISGMTDGHATDRLFLEPMATKSGGKYYLLSGTLTSDVYGIGISKNSPYLLSRINKVLWSMELNGDLDKIKSKHLHGKKFKKLIRKVDNYKIYTVEPGDSLTHIAYLFYKDYGRWNDIYEANEIITDPNVIKVGWRLNIPKKPKSRNNIDNQYIEGEEKCPSLKCKEEDMECRLARLECFFVKGLITEDMRNKKQDSILKGL